MSLTLGERMKTNYEYTFRQYLPKRLPIIMRLDGKAFHTFTRGLEKPFDEKLIKTMEWVAMNTTDYIQGSVFAYTQSDEISILIYPWTELNSECWFNGNIQKMVSVSAAYTSVWFHKMWSLNTSLEFEALFDSRVFVIPESEVVNYFIWRQEDWIRNSVQMLGQSQFSHKQLQGKNNLKIKEMLKNNKNIDWDELDNNLKYGSYIKKNNEGKFKIYRNTPLFKENRQLIENTIL